MTKKNRNVVGEQVRKIRNERALSQARLAGICQRHGWNITREIIARIEGRERWVADFELLLLAQMLEVSVDQLLPLPKAWLLQRDAFLQIQRSSL